jgi:hypothetical protein
MYTVRWKRSARDELTDLWLQADPATRQAITRASHQVDQRLAHDPDTVGESRPNGRRIFFCRPLGLVFRVDAQARAVYVLHVWSAGN